VRKNTVSAAAEQCNKGCVRRSSSVEPRFFDPCSSADACTPDMTRRISGPRDSEMKSDEVLPWTPMVMIRARGDLAEGMVGAGSAGADDYLAASFNLVFRSCACIGAAARPEAAARSRAPRRAAPRCAGAVRGALLPNVLLKMRRSP
jgi:hypothetical protein